MYAFYLCKGEITMMDIKKVAVTSVAGLLLGGIPLTTGAQVVSANEVTTQSTGSNKTSSAISDELVSRVDDYVVVKNNRYVLELPDSVKNSFTSSEIAEVESFINKANENIKDNSLVVDTQSKTTESEPQVMNRAAWNAHFTWKNFWWGTRYYFTSNSAVNEFVWDFTNKAIAMGALAAAGSLGGVVAGILPAVTGAYFAKVANDLNYYNQRHTQNQIYLDINYSLGYSFHILK